MGREPGINSSDKRARSTSAVIINPNLGHISLWARIDAARYSRYDLQGDERAGRLMISAEEK